MIPQTNKEIVNNIFFKLCIRPGDLKDILVSIRDDDI